MEEKSISEKIKELKEEIEQTDLRNIPAKQLAQYLVKVDQLKALMNAYEKMKLTEKGIDEQGNDHDGENRE